jgi:hypothetical protein
MKFTALLVVVTGTLCLAQQMADPDFDATVAHPAYTDHHPRVAIDEAHHNLHKKDGLFKSFAALAQSDGYNVVTNTKPFTADVLRAFDVLVISNALGELTDDNNHSVQAFTNVECDAVYDWVRHGGALFLVADHAPMGDAAAPLAERLGVTLGRGIVFDTDSGAIDSDEEITTMVFTERNHLLGDHAIIRGRNDSERLHRIVAFTGESMTAPRGAATTLLQLSPTAGEAPTRKDLRPLNAKNVEDAKAARLAEAKKSPAGGRAMAIAYTLGRGRVVVNGEAGMLSAQVFKQKNKDGAERFVDKMGMNVPGNDDRQYVLNVLHWLSGALK